MTTDDFSLTLRNLPPYKTYHSLLELKASLWSHLEKVLSNLPEGQVVNIHFARADVKKLKILLRIKNIDTELKREMARYRIY